MEDRTIPAGCVQIPMSELTPALTCVMCGGYWRRPYTLTDCLHSFCKTCLQRAWLHHKGWCPYPGCGVAWGGSEWSSQARHDTAKDNFLKVVLEAINYSAETGISLSDDDADAASMISARVPSPERKAKEKARKAALGVGDGAVAGVKRPRVEVQPKQKKEKKGGRWPLSRLASDAGVPEGPPPEYPLIGMQPYAMPIVWHGVSTPTDIKLLQHAYLRPKKGANPAALYISSFISNLFEKFTKNYPERAATQEIRFFMLHKEFSNVKPAELEPRMFQAVQRGSSAFTMCLADAADMFAYTAVEGGTILSLYFIIVPQGAVLQTPGVSSTEGSPLAASASPA